MKVWVYGEVCGRVGGLPCYDEEAIEQAERGEPSDLICYEGTAAELKAIAALLEQRREADGGYRWRLAASLRQAADE